MAVFERPLQGDFKRAADYYKKGKCATCRNLLSRMHQQGYSRLHLYLQCNILICEYKESLLQCNLSRVNLKEILFNFEKLWHRLKGVEPSHFSLPVELVVVLAICQLNAVLSHWIKLKPLINCVLYRVSKVTGSSVDITSTEPEAFLSFGGGFVKCFEKLRMMYALGGLVDVVVEKTAFEVLVTHSYWLGGDQTELFYKKAWQQFRQMEYESSLSILSEVTHSAPGFTHYLSPLVNLLSGACHAKLNHPQLALLHWKKCLECNHRPTFLAALQNSAIIYNSRGSYVSAIENEKLVVEVLMSKDDQLNIPLWVWLESDKTDHRSLAAAMLCLAWRQIRHQQYEEACGTIKKCLANIQDGATTTPLECVSSLNLNLLLSVCEMAGDQEAQRRGHEICRNILSAVTPPWSTKVMSILATISLYLGECRESVEWSLRCLEEVECVAEGTDKISIPNLSFQLQCHSQILLSLVAIVHTQWKEAMELLSYIVTTPIGLYNYCLLQCKVGMVMDGASGWLRNSTGLPTGKIDAKDKLLEMQQLLTQSKNVVSSKKMYNKMDVAMLKLWIQHCLLN